jgi:predicted transcriptional regulator
MTKQPQSPISIRISAEAARILDAMAEAENRSRSNMIETLILRTSRKK